MSRTPANRRAPARLFVWLLLAAAPALAGCGDQVVGPGRTAAVTIRDNSFSPQTVIIARGTAVRWTNSGAVAHTSVADGGAWSSGNIAPQGTFSHTFNTLGTFAYRCTLHAGMTGTILVE
jgi:plastocyanin